MKKNYFLIISLALTLLFYGCGGGKEKKETMSSDQPQTEQSADQESTANNAANSENPDPNSDDKTSKKGCNLDQKEFDKAEVFERLTPGRNQLPSQVSLQKYLPKVLSQGSQGSCTAWACTYYARTILEAVATGENANSFALSPAYIYNQLSRGSCEGTNIGKALDLIKAEGAATLKDFPYNDSDCRTQPSSSIEKIASRFKLRGYNRLTMKDNDYKVDIQAIKQNIAQNAPVVIGIPVGGTFYELNGKMWKPTAKDYKTMRAGGDAHVVDDGTEAGFGGHAMCIIGYDDNYEGGAFQIVNSWGADWADGGIFWMPYKDFEQFSNEYYGEAYGLFPVERKKENKSDADFKVAVGLVKFKTNEYLPLNFKNGSTFETDGILAKKTAFKIEVTNSVECYTYVFGQETDGSSYVLFPYTPKHSAFCGIVGTRLFPKDFSMQLDDLGKKDFMAVVVTKEALDFKALNDKISQSKAATYEGKIREALGNTLVTKVQYKGGETANFEALSEGKNAVLLVMEINKK